MNTPFRLTRLAEEVLFDLHWAKTFELSETLEQEVVPTGRAYFYHLGGINSGILREHYVSSRRITLRYLELPDGCICAPTFLGSPPDTSRHVVNAARSILTNKFTDDCLFFDKEHGYYTSYFRRCAEWHKVN